MANDIAVAGQKPYGGLRPSGSVGADEFAAHDATQTWHDGGAGEGLLGEIAQAVDRLKAEVPAYGAEQAKLAVMEYMTASWGDICIVEGQLCFMIDSSNDAASFAVFWKLTDLLQKAVAEAENAGDQQVLAAIHRFLEQMGATFRPPVAAAARGPARPLRQGHGKPSVGGGAGRAGALRPGAAHNQRVAATPPRSSP